LEEHDAFAASFARDMHLSGCEPGTGDLLILPTAIAAEVEGLGRWLGRRHSIVHVACLFHWGTTKSLAPETFAARLLANALNKLKAAGSGELWLGAMHLSLQTALSAIVPDEVHLVPSVTFFPDLGQPQLQREAQSRVPSIGVMGGARYSKGIAVIPELALRANAEALDVNFVVQAHGGAKSILLELPSWTNNVAVFEDWLDGESFVQMIERLDAALLPYERSEYQAMVSGVFTLAAASGLPCIVPSDTWMSERIKSGEAVGVIYEGSDVCSILSAIRTFLNNQVELRFAAQERRSEWSWKYSGDRLFERLAG
jgi:glycosyltransferase involved in cell wall biosynthesis